MRREMVHDIARYLPAQIVPAVMSFFSIPILTHFFPPSDYGDYVLVLASVTVMTTLSGLFSTAIIRFYPACERDGKQIEFYNTVLMYNLLLSLGLAFGCELALILARPILSHTLFLLMQVGVLLFIFDSIFQILTTFFRAQRRISLYSGLLIWRSVIGVGLACFMVLALQVGIEAFLWGLILSLAVILPFVWKPAMNRCPFDFTRVSKTLGRGMVRFGFPLVVSNLFSQVIYLSDRYILGIFRSSQEIGIYSANYDLSYRTIMLIVTLFGLTSGSIAFHVWEKEGKQKSREFASELTRFYFIVGFPSAMILSVLANPVIRILTGPEYHSGARVIPIVVLGSLIFGLQQRFQIGLHFYKKTHLIMTSVVAAGILNLGLNLLLVPRYGYMAAAFVTLVSYILLLVLMIIFSRRYFFWEFPMDSLLRILSASVVMGAAILLVGPANSVQGIGELLGRIGIGIIIYICAILLSGEIRQSEIQMARKILSWKFRQ